MSIMDAAVPSIVAGPQLDDPLDHKNISEAEYQESFAEVQRSVAGAPGGDLFRIYLAERPSRDPAFVYNTRRNLQYAPNALKRQLGTVLSALS